MVRDALGGGERGELSTSPRGFPPPSSGRGKAAGVSRFLSSDCGLPLTLGLPGERRDAGKFGFCASASGHAALPPRDTQPTVRERELPEGPRTGPLRLSGGGALCPWVVRDVSGVEHVRRRCEKRKPGAERQSVPGSGQR